jgi:hypothetical protein
MQVRERYILREICSSRIKQKKLDFLHLPIIDGTITTDSAMERWNPLPPSPSSTPQDVSLSHHPPSRIACRVDSRLQQQGAPNSIRATCPIVAEKFFRGKRLIEDVFSGRLEDDVRHRILKGEGIYIHCELLPISPQ